MTVTSTTGKTVTTAALADYCVSFTNASSVVTLTPLTSACLLQIGMENKICKATRLFLQPLYHTIHRRV